MTLCPAEWMGDCNKALLALEAAAQSMDDIALHALDYMNEVEQGRIQGYCEEINELRCYLKGLAAGAELWHHDLMRLSQDPDALSRFYRGSEALHIEPHRHT